MHAVVDYVIDGIEEEIRDTVEHMIHAIENDPNNNTNLSKSSSMQSSMNAHSNVDKFEKLKDILTKLSNSNRYTNNIRALRILLIIVLSCGELPKILSYTRRSGNNLG